MKIKWLIESTAYPNDENPQRIGDAARSRGCDVIDAKYRPFGDGFEWDGKKNKIDPTDWIIYYGSINLARWLQRHAKFNLVLWADFETVLRCRTYYAYLGPYLLNQEYAFMPLKEIARRKDWVYQTFGGGKSGDTVFIRPDDNAKSFAGELVWSGRFDDFYEMSQFYGPSEHQLALVGKPVEVSSEWRVIVANKKVVTGSMYRKDKLVEIAPGVPPHVAAYVEWVCNSSEFEPHPIYVIDIAATPDGLRVVEIGSVNTAGLYEIDAQAFVDAALAIAEQEMKDSIVD